MKDTVDQIYDELNAQVVRMLEHSLNQASRIAQLEHENARLDAALDEEISTRDQYHEWADRLAAEIARYFGVDIGEHSNANNPWEQAYEAVPAAPSAPSAPAVEQHSPAVVAWAVTSDNTKGIHKLSIKRESADRKAAVWLEEWPNNPVRVRPLAFADVAPQAADTDKVREAILALRCTNPYAEDKCNLYKEGYAVARQEAADLVASMAGDMG